jgi:hypothetical protein
MTTRRLEQRRQWLSLEDAARFLANALGEPCSPAHLLGLVLDQGLALSVELAPGTWALRQDRVEVVAGRRMRLQHREPIEGVWDVVLDISARRHVYAVRQTLAGFDPPELAGIGGAWVAREGECRQLEPVKAVPTGMSPVRASAFPRDSVLGVRRSVLDAFIATVNASSLTINAGSVNDASSSGTRTERFQQNRRTSKSPRRQRRTRDTPTFDLSTKDKRRAASDLFVRRTNVSGLIKPGEKDVVKADIARVAGYSRETFNRWQRQDVTSSAKHHRKFSQVLALRPKDFLERLRRLGSGEIGTRDSALKGN